MMIPEGGAGGGNAILSELGELAQNKEILYKPKRTFSGKHLRPPPYLVEAQEGTPPDQILALDPTKNVAVKGSAF